MNKKKVLILNGSLSEIPLIQEAKKLGYYVVTSGNAPDLIGHQYADEYIRADYSDKEAILKLVKENNIDRIVSCANDFGTITAAYVAEQMGWPGHDTYENTLLLHQKDNFKALVQRLGIRAPLSVPFSSREQALAYARQTEYPIIVKATDLTGGKGILRANNYEEAVVAIDNALNRSRQHHLVIEPFLVGVQQSIDTFVKRGKVIASVSNDTFSPINPYLIQSEILPAQGIEKIQDELHAVIEKICRELKLVDGMFTLQYIICDGKPYIIEMMRRCLGNQFLTVAHAVSGFPWEEALMRAETGMDLDMLQWEKPLAKVTGHHGIMATHNGRIKGYTIDEAVEKHIFKKIDIIKPGEFIQDFMNERVAYIYYTFDDRDEAVRIVSRMNELIHIEFMD